MEIAAIESWVAEVVENQPRFVVVRVFLIKFQREVKDILVKEILEIKY